VEILKWVLFSCKPVGEELMDVNGHGVTLFFYISTKEWADFVIAHGSSAGSGYRLLRFSDAQQLDQTIVLERQGTAPEPRL
jgi:hypothetical protein